MQDCHQEGSNIHRSGSLSATAVRKADPIAGKSINYNVALQVLVLRVPMARLLTRLPFICAAVLQS
jgi:hypothetical protein